MECTVFKKLPQTIVAPVCHRKLFISCGSRLHESFGWLCCRTFTSLEAAESFSATLTPDGDLPEGALG